jgi:hypothetical protein
MPSGILASDFQFLRSMLDSQAKIENRTLNFEIVRPFSKGGVCQVVENGLRHHHLLTQEQQQLSP